MKTISLTQFAEIVDGEICGTDVQDIDVAKFATDSRRVNKGDIFFALLGERFDGHDFIEMALKRRAAVAVVDEQHADQVCDQFTHSTFLIVEDTEKALGRMANWYRQQLDPLIVGVTGSVGKTTTRHMIHTVLSEQFQGVQSPRNFNNEIGVPLSVMALAEDDEFAVLELAASKQGDIKLLSKIAQPEIGVLTAIGHAHLESFGSLDVIATTKAELLEALPESGLAILSGDDSLVREQASKAKCRVLFVGAESHNDIQAEEIKTENNQLSFRIGSEKISVPVIGSHHLTAVLSAVAVGREVGMDADAIQNGLSKYRSIPGRSHLETIGDWTVINDCYNANPMSMKAACQSLASWKTSYQKIFIAGEMLDLGAESAQFHFELGQKAAQSNLDFLLAIGPHANDIVRGAFSEGFCSSRMAVFEQIDTLFVILSCWIQTGDIVWIKGSRDMHLERVIDWLREQAESTLDTHSTYALPRAA